MGAAHDFLAGYNFEAFHAPGPGDCFRVTSLKQPLGSAHWIEVIDRATSPEIANERIQTAYGLIGAPWTFMSSNCQDYISYIVAGHPRSFQREGVYGFALAGLVFCALVQ